VRVGLLARCENRGLGIQTMEFHRHIGSVPLLLDLGTPLDNCGMHPEWYPGARRVKFRGILPERPVRAWLDEVDVIYTAETSYHGQLPHWARKHGVDLVVHINPEFHRDDNDATRWWAPSSWRLPFLPTATQVVPVPVATDRWPNPAEPHREPCRWLHVAGRQALADRNGTDALLAAIPYLTERCVITIASQTDRPFAYDPNPLVEVRTVGPTDNYWDLYNGHDALVMPRRYGGLCLPVQESMGAGLAVLMSDVSPNQDWPVSLCRTLPGGREQMPAGRIEVAQIDSLNLAEMMDLYADPDLRADRQEVSRTWARRHSWDVWAPKYRDLMGARVAA
jgi:hypothetical protein